MKLAREIKLSTACLYCTLFFFLGIPAGFYLKSYNPNVPRSVVKKTQESMDLVKKQREEADLKFIEGVIAWQKQHPAEPLPKDYLVVIERVLGKK